MVDIIATRPETSDGGTVLPQLPESQVARPPSAPGRAVPGDASAVQVQDDYFTLPKIGSGSHMLEDTLYADRRKGGTKTAKYEDDEELDADGGAGTATRGRDASEGKTGGAGQGPVGSEGRAGTTSVLDDRSSQRGHTAMSEMSMLPADSRTGTAGMAANTRRGPLPTQRKASGMDTGSIVPRSGTHSNVGRAGTSMGGGGGDTGLIAADERHMLSPRRDEGGEGGDGGEGKETIEERLGRIRNSNMRRDFRPGGDRGGGAGAGAGAGAGGHREVSELNQGRLQPTSPRRARPAEMEFSGKTEYFDERPDMILHKAERKGTMFAWPYGKERGVEETAIDLEVIEVKKVLRASFLRLVEKPAPDIESKPPPALSVEAGDSAKNKHLANMPELAQGSDEVPRGEHGEGRQVWYAREGQRAGVIRLPLGGQSSENDKTVFRLQPAVAHGIDIGFERTMAHSAKRAQGTQMSEKELSQENFHVPSGGYLPSEANRTKHIGSDGSRAQARAEVAVAAPIKLPRQEGFMVDRNKDSGIEESRVAAVRVTATREQAITRNDDITEEQRLAQKHSGVLEGPGKLEDTDYDVLDLRPSELAVKVKEKRGSYAVPKDPGANERRDSRPVPMELQLKPPAFERAKGTGEDKMRSSYY